MVQSYFDPDGLYRKYGILKTVANNAGEFKTYGALRDIEVKVDLTTLAVTTPLILSDQEFFPKNVRIEEVVVETITAATSSGSGTIDFGLISTDRATEVDFNGFIAAEVKGTVDTAGKKVTYVNGTSKAGALIGTTNATVGYLCANVNTAVYQTGVVIFRVRYSSSID